MKKKVYQKPTMNIVECEQETELLAASTLSLSNTVEDYNWNDYEEE